MACGVRVTDRGLAPVTIETISGLAVIGRPMGPLGKKEKYTLDWTPGLGLRDVRQVLSVFQINIGLSAWSFKKQIITCD